MAEQSERQPGAGVPVNPDEGQLHEVDAASRPRWREVFQQAFDKAIREQQPTSRRELGRDRSRALFLIVGAAIAVVLLLLGVFSSPNTKKATTGRPLGTPELGRRVPASEQPNGQTGSITPLLNARAAQPDASSNQDVTPEEIERTARLTQPLVRPSRSSVTSPAIAGPYALGRINFSDSARRQETSVRSTATSEPTSDDLRKPSLVFLRSAKSNAADFGSGPTTVPAQESPAALNLPAGTRLLARLQAVVSSAIKTPVVAAIEYNYERDGEIVVPAGAQVIGNLQQADRSGYVGIRFDTIRMPDGSMQKIDATAMSLGFGPLKGVVSGKNTGTNFLVRALTGIGQATSFVIGSNGLNAPLSQGALLRDQVATNVGIAGDQQLNSLASHQNIAVFVPGNTRFYVVIQERAAWSEEQTQPVQTQETGNRSLPSVEELRQLLQLRQELSALNQQPSEQSAAQSESQ
jgi:hypothetical protein